MTKAKAITEQLIRCLENISPRNGYITELANIYPHAAVAPDRAALPCALVRVAADNCTGMASTQATRERLFEIEVVFKRGASQDDLDAAHVDILRSLGFGKHEYEREMKGLLTDQQEAEFEFASQGNNFTTVTITVAFIYVENYA